MVSTRRDFLRQSASALAATIILPQALQARILRSGEAPSDQLRLALIGCRSMGWYDLTDLMNHPNMYCAALCDIDQTILANRADEAQKRWGNRPDTYTDYRRILERKDIDAVVIGTPDHWHCLIMTDACSAGKDVYVEKPAANSIAECDAMVAAQQRYGRVVQVGQQQRSSQLWHEMKRIVDSGELGTIPRVNVWANFAYAAILNHAQDSDVPAEVDFDMWLGPAPKRSFNASRFHGSWRMFWDYGGGLVTDWGVHLLDMAFWAMNVTGMPLRVAGSGANHTYPDNFAETFDTLSVFYGFPDLLIQWSNVTIESGPYGMNYGLEFKGTKGTLVVNREKMELYPQGENQPSQQWKPTNNEHLDHTTNFIECVRSRRFDTACTIQNGAFCAKMAHLGNIAARTGHALTYDDQHHTFHDKAADRLIIPTYRKPWKLFRLVLLLLSFCFTFVSSAQAEGTFTLTKSVLLDKIKGGWAGQTIGCAYGGPTEFCYRGVMIPDDVEISYPEHHLKNYFDNLPSLFDDVYMDLTFVDVFSRLGLDAPADSFANAFAYAAYPLWHANQQGRYNVLHGLMPPESGYWKNNPHADCIDYQIESDYAGLMSPGMPNSASEISDKIGHIMNYGDGWYGGVFVGAMYALAFVESDVVTIVEKALQTIPEGSRFRERLDCVVKWYKEKPSDWKRAWKLYNESFSKDLGCPELILAPGNIDATMNSAYVAMGLLYGHGDFGKTMEIATRCGQDSDCNPSSAAGVLATMLGYSNIPEKWMPNLREVESRKFAYSKLSLNDTYSAVYNLALKMIEAGGGSIGDDDVTIQVQEPAPVRLEQGFVGMYPKLLTSGIQYLGTDDAGQNTFRFHGCGIVVYGNISYSTGSFVAQLEVTVDGEVSRVMPLQADFNKRTADAIYWNYDLEDGAHEVSFKLLNPRKGVNIKADRVIYYVTDDTPVVPTLQPIIFNGWGDGFNNGTSADFTGDGIHDLFLCGGNIGGHVLQGTGVASTVAYHEVSNIGDIGNIDFLATIYPVDFDGDGQMDLVAFDSEPSGLTTDDGGPEGIFLGNGKGAFHVAPTAVYKADGVTPDDVFKWIWVKSADVADFNNDGLLDLVVCSDRAAYNCLLLGMGKDESGTFCFKKADYDKRHLYTIQNSAWDRCMGYVKAYDFNSDGYMDFMLSGSNKANKTVIFINSSEEPGTFKTVNFPTHRNLPSFDFADVNSDGIPEIYFSGEYHEGWYNQIYTPVFDGQKMSYRLYYGLPWQNNDRCMGFRSSAFVDWDGDGIIDIIQTGRSDTELPDGTTLDSRASKIRINWGDGLEWADPILTIGSNLNTAILADVNNDGVIDYVRNGENELAVNIEGLKYGTGQIFSVTINPSKTAYHPSAPVLNTPVVDGKKVTLSWQPASNAIGNETYEYVVFDGSGKVVAGTNVAYYPNGFRKTPASGNACQARQIVLSLPAGQYTYGVQTVSGAYIGSAFAQGTFKVDEDTGIKPIDNGQLIMDNEDDAWYDLGGWKLQDKAIAKGVYINNSRKFVKK